MITIEDRSYKMELTKEQVEWLINMDEIKENIKTLEKQLDNKSYQAQTWKQLNLKILESIGYNAPRVEKLPEVMDRKENEYYIRDAGQSTYLVINFDELERLYKGRE